MDTVDCFEMPFGQISFFLGSFLTEKRSRRISLTRTKWKKTKTKKNNKEKKKKTRRSKRVRHFVLVVVVVVVLNCFGQRLQKRELFYEEFKIRNY